MPEVFFAFFLLNYYFFSLNPQVFFAVNFELKQCPWFPKVLYLLFSLNHHMYLGYKVTVDRPSALLHGFHQRSGWQRARDIDPM